jgi:Polyketide cyclase / dehydrase and lipid transport
MSPRSRYFTGLMILVILIAGSYALLHAGAYGWTVFVVLPSFLGGLACWVIPPERTLCALGIGALSVTVASFSLLFLGIEGFGCILMCIPLVAPLGALGGWIVYRATSASVAPRSAAMLVLLPFATLTFDLKVPPTVFEVHSQVTVAATPEQVWKHVVTFSDLPEPDEWFFRAGLAYPKRARIEGTGPGAIRYCEFSTGPFVEPIEIWDEPRLLAFRVTQNPAPMNEWSPYAQVLPKHLHGYFISKHGQFKLTSLPDGGTLLEGTTWYQHGLWPGEYWRWWSDPIIHRIHLRVLNHVKMLAERENAVDVSKAAAPRPPA